MSALQRFLGDSPARVFLKLVVVSFLVGLVMSTFGWWPTDIFRWIADSFQRIWDMGFSAIERAGGYILLGAAIVVPLFLILRLMRYRRG